MYGSLGSDDERPGVTSISNSMLTHSAYVLLFAPSPYASYPNSIKLSNASEEAVWPLRKQRFEVKVQFLIDFLSI